MNRTSIWSISLLMTMTLIMMISCSGSDGGSEGGSGSNGDGWYAKGFITSFPITISAYGDSRDYVKAHVDELFLDNGRYGGIISFPGDNTVTHGPAYQHDEIEAVHLTNNGVLEYYEGYLYKCGSSGTMGKTLLYKVTGSPLGDVGFYASSPECFNYTREGNVIKVTINNVTKTFTVASDGALVIEGEKYYKFNFGQTYVDNSGSDDDKEDAEVIAAAQSVSKTAEVVGNPTFHTAVFKCTFGYSSQEGRYNKVFAFSKNRSDLENSNDLARRYYGLNNNITHPNSYSSSLNSVNGTDMSNGYREDGDLRFANENTADLNKIYVEYDDLNVTIYYCPVIMFASKAFPGEIKSLNLRQLKQTSGFVDLGLSCLWSATNNRASTPWDLGSSITLLNANVSGGGRLPTKDEVLGLNNCKLEVIDNGVLVTGSNGNEIFIPFRNTNGYSIYNYGTGSTQKSGSNTYDVLFEYDSSTRKFTTKKSTSSINIGSYTMHTDAYVRPVKDGSGGGGGGDNPSLTEMVLKDMLQKPLGIVDIDIWTSSYANIVQALSAQYNIYTSNDNFILLSAYNNTTLSNLSYKGIPFSSFYFSKYSTNTQTDTGCTYNFEINQNSLSNPYEAFEKMVADFTALGVPMTSEKNVYGYLIHAYYWDNYTSYSVSLELKNDTYIYWVGKNETKFE